MNKKTIFLVLSIIVLLVLVFYFLLGPRGYLTGKMRGELHSGMRAQQPFLTGIILGEHDVSVKLPTPYPRSQTEERTLLWEKEINLEELLDFENINLYEITSDFEDYVLYQIDVNNLDLTLDKIIVRLNFEKFNVLGGYTENMYSETDFGECDLNAPEGYTRTLIDPNTIAQQAIVEDDPESGVYSVGSLETIYCGVVSEKMRVYFDHHPLPDESFNFLTYSQLYEGRDLYLSGDFIVIKDSDDNVIYVSNSSQNSFPRISFEYTDSIKIEFYGVNQDQIYGDNLDIFNPGFHLDKIYFIKSMVDDYIG